MDTNQLAQLIGALSKQPQAGLDNTQIIIAAMIIAAAAPTLASIIVYFKARATAACVDKIHVAVNSERTAMMEEVKKLKDEILQLSKNNSTLEENKRGSEVAKTVADAQKATA